ncbi:kinesin-like protein KIFC1 [Cuculus canorus]|uniref:kinesin-like protein KIFC1 n=1 Tax=Cuculus canorus TaxID=55661 RepID=UPI0023AA9EF5|nr:kinesin-like protein KIFC1 [Cuculus canorus]
MAAAPGTAVAVREGPIAAPSRLPVRAAKNKRPAPPLEEAAAPEQKRSRPAPVRRAPLKALSATAATRAGPQKTASATAAPRNGPVPPRPKRAPWDLRGQVRDLQEALSDCRERSRQLETELQGLRRDMATTQEELQERQRHESHLQQRLREVEAELLACREAAERWQREAQDLAAEKRRTAEELERRGRALAQARDEADAAGARLRDTQGLLGQWEARAARAEARAEALEAAALTREQRLHGLELQRRHLHNLLLELKGNIRVFCRVRPVLPEEAEKQKELHHLHFPPDDPTALVLSRPDESHTGRERRGDVRYDFSFDRVFAPGASQQEVFEEIALLVQSALDGYHVCIFAYGQTGSGKTYTMEGPDTQDPETWGVIPRAMSRIFHGARDLAEKGWEYDFSASILEIYNEAVRDLLGTKPERGADLEIRRVSAASEELHVPNLRCVPVASDEEVLKLLQTAAANRSVAQTALNDRSSRSHCVFQLRIRGVNNARQLRCSSVLSLVDLAGSERLEKSLARGERLRETQAINTSLSALARVITALANKEPHIPYRNSKLTYLLQNYLGGSAKMLMFVNISPLEENFSESLNSLRFASQVNSCMVGTAHANRK